MDQLNHVMLESGAESYVTEACRRTFRYIYVHVSQFDSCAEDLEKYGNFICLESGNPDQTYDVTFTLIHSASMIHSDTITACS